MLRYARLDTLCLVRSLYFLVFSVAFSAGFYLMFTVVVRDALSTSPDFARNYMVAMSISGAFFGALNGGGIRLGAERGDGWTRQVLLTPLSPRAYLGAKAITAWALILPAVIVVFLLGGLVNGVSLSAGQWIATGAVIWGTGLVFVLAGLTVGLVAVGEAAQFTSLAVYFPLAMLGGLWFPIDSFPQELRTVAEFLPTHAVYVLAQHTADGSATGSATTALLVLLCWAAGLATVVLARSRPAVLVRV